MNAWDSLKEFKTAQRKLRPSIGRYQLEQISFVIAKSVQDGVPVVITMYDELSGELKMTGTILQLNQMLKRIKFRHSDGVEFIPFEDVISAELVGSN